MAEDIGARATSGRVEAGWSPAFGSDPILRPTARVWFRRRRSEQDDYTDNVNTRVAGQTDTQTAAGLRVSFATRSGVAGTKGLSLASHLGFERVLEGQGTATLVSGTTLRSDINRNRFLTGVSAQWQGNDLNIQADLNTAFSGSGDIAWDVGLTANWAF